ncbi:hypothetical protein JY479_08760 [Serratia marcescens]|nr:hypothetical protein [Serratia marcescens]
MAIFNNPDLYKFIIFQIVVFMVLGYCLYLLNDIDLTIKRRRYQTAIKQAVNSGRLEDEDIYPLATRWLVKKEKITETLYLILSDYLNDEHCSNEKLSRIRSLISWHKSNEPFSDLPDDINFQMQKIYRIAGDCQDDIVRLSKSLSEIYLSNQRKVKRERLISLSSLLVGIIGLMYGFFN